MGKQTPTTTKKTAAKRAVKSAPDSEAPSTGVTVNGTEPKPAPKAKRVRTPAVAAKTEEPKAKKAAAPKKKANGTKSVAKLIDVAPKREFSQHDIAQRAYFIAQNRIQYGQFGSPDGDWLEAERQLREESLN